MMNNKSTLPLVSIIIPSYNHEAYIGDAIDSVLQQSYPELELIIVDDGSQDGSVDVISRYSDSRLKLITQINHGAHHAINEGLMRANGDYIAILNSDDIFHPERLQKCIDYMSSCPEVSLVSTWIDVINQSGRKLGVKHGWHDYDPWYLGDPNISFKKTDDYSLNLLAANFVSTTSNVVFRREVYDKYGGMRNCRFVHDWDFMLRVAAEEKCAQIAESLLSYRVHGNNTISSNRAWMMFEICWVLAANIDSFLKKKSFFVDEGTDIDRVTMIFESINFQGNDKLFWLILLHIRQLRELGRNDAETYILDNAGIRQKYISLVVSEADAGANPGFLKSFLSKIRQKLI